MAIGAILAGLGAASQLGSMFGGDGGAGAALREAAGKAQGLVGYGAEQQRNDIQQGLYQFQNYLGQATGAIAPQTLGSYTALDSYFDALGIARPSAGSRDYAAKAADYNAAKNQLASVIQRRDEIKGELESGWNTFAQRPLLQSEKTGFGSLGYQLQEANKWIDSLTATMNIKGGIVNEVELTDPEAQQANVLNTLRNSPGYLFTQERGITGIENSAAARGSLLSGGTLQNLIEFNQNLADTTYGNYVDRMANAAGLTAPYAGATSTALGNGGGTVMNQYNAKGQAMSDAFNNMANIAMGAGGAQAGLLGTQAQAQSGALQGFGKSLTSLAGYLK